MKCPEGQYYRFDDEKCKPIPKGKKVRKDGELIDAGGYCVLYGVDVGYASFVWCKNHRQNRDCKLFDRKESTYVC